MDEEPGPKPTAKFPSFIIIIIGILLLLGILIFLFFFFKSSPTGFLTGNAISANPSSLEDLSNSRCEIYATQFGLNSSLECLNTNEGDCLAFCKAHFECCKN